MGSTRKMRRFQIYLEPAMNGQLERLAAKTGKAKAELVRDGINLLLAEETAKHGDPLLEIVGMAGEAGLPEASERHDDYLYGERKERRGKGKGDKP